mgnify:CR=1 FL=1
MSVMAETSQSAMGPHLAMAAVGFALKAWTSVIREALVVKIQAEGGEGDAMAVCWLVLYSLAAVLRPAVLVKTLSTRRRRRRRVGGADWWEASNTGSHCGGQVTPFFRLTQSDLWRNYTSLFANFAAFNTWISAYDQVMTIVPYALTAPLMFAQNPANRITLGTLMQVSNAFDKVFGAMAVVSENWNAVNDFRSTVHRLRVAQVHRAGVRLLVVRLRCKVVGARWLVVRHTTGTAAQGRISAICLLGPCVFLVFIIHLLCLELGACCVVGFDFPNANLIIIENANKFGLSQLHQLRGRVGRGTKQASCILMFKSNLSVNAKKRINILKNSNDGFQISEEDMKLRGFGDLLGFKQSGVKNFRLADPIQNEDLFLMAEKQIKKIESENININKYKALLKLYDQADIINDIV